MRKQNTCVLCAAAAGMLVLIIDGQTALSGMREGIEICLQTLIPSLFPLFVLSGILISGLTGQDVPLLRPICKLCHMHPGSESLLAIGILGGYPVGAANIANVHRDGQLTTEESTRYAIFCNNAGPSFLFGILRHVFPDISWLIALWLIQITASVLTGFTLTSYRTRPVYPGQRHETVSETVNKAIRNMAGVCAWVVLFRMCLSFLDQWFLNDLQPVPQILLAGLLELSNGCLRLEQVGEPELRFVMASAMLSLGGLSILMQTKAVFPQLHTRRYIAGKLIHLTFSMLLSWTLVLMMSGRIAIGVCSVFLLSAIFVMRLFRVRKTKKRGSNSVAVVV